MDLTEFVAAMQPESNLLVNEVLTDEAAIKVAEETAAMNKKIQDFSGSLATDYQSIVLFATIPFFLL
jgi:hypothetical protein